MADFFNLKDISSEDLKKLGLSEKKLLDRDEDVAKLLSGKMTDFFRIKLKDPKVSMEAKLSLQRVNGIPMLMVHPILRDIDKKYDFSAEEKRVLDNGDVVLKKWEGKEYLMQQDKDTKTIIKIPKEQLTIPNSVLGHELSNEEKLTLRNAGKVNFPGGGKIKIDFQSLDNVTTEKQLSVDINKNQEIGR